MLNEKQKNYVLIGAGVVIALLVGKLLFQKPVYMPMGMGGSSEGDNKGGKKSLSPYHDHQVKNTIMKNRIDVINCYNAFVDRNPPVTDGPFKVDFEIDSDGEVIKSDFIGGVGDEELVNCVTGAIKKWKFPEPVNMNTPVYVDHTFTLKKRENEETPQDQKSKNKKSGVEIK